MGQRTLTLAVGKGRVLNEVLPLLERAGIGPAENPLATRKLVLETTSPGLEIMVLRSTDVPTYVQFGAADLGIVGKDVLLETEAPDFYEPLDLGVARCRMVVAEPGQSTGSPAARPRVATKYPRTARAHFARRGVQAEIIHLYGSMELAPGAGLAHQVVDLVDTGSTLAANGLVEVETIVDVSARLIVSKASMKTCHDAVKRIIDALAGATSAGAQAPDGDSLSTAATPRPATIVGRRIPARLDTGDASFASEFGALLERAAVEMDSAVESTVRDIVSRVAREGDAALIELTDTLDGFRASTAADLELPRGQMDEACEALDASLREALRNAAARIRDYHERQVAREWSFEDEWGTRLGARVTPLDRVGLYVPGGKAAYPSSVLMTAIPARVAGVGELVMCVPATGGGVSEAVLAAASIAGVDRVFQVGGAQAIAAMAHGTATVPRVDKIVGPGNAYVAAAKRMVFGRVGIDVVAGPSEVVVVADESADPVPVTMDLLAQAEHDELAQAILISPSVALIDAVLDEIESTLPTLERGSIVAASLAGQGAVIRVADLDEAWELVNAIAPEHLEIVVRDPRACLPRVRHAGAIFLGPHSAEALGDYCAGPNHVLPTSGTARFSSPLGVHDFQKTTSLIECTAAGAGRLAPTASTIARAEALTAHARAAELREARVQRS